MMPRSFLFVVAVDSPRGDEDGEALAGSSLCNPLTCVAFFGHNAQEV